MRVLCLTAVLCAALAFPGAAVEPMQWAGGGGMLPGGSGREVCWRDVPDYEGLIGSSEVIGMFGLETELANDFMFEGGVRELYQVRWWGGYYNYVPGDPQVTSFNLMFYEEGAHCVPGTLRSQAVVGHNAHETFVYNQGGMFPIYEYWVDWRLEAFPPDVRFWFAAQAGDHPFPPQWGRLAADRIQACDSMFRSVFFSYPDWTVDPFIPFDASQEFSCREQPVAAPSASWGSIKSLYR